MLLREALELWRGPPLAELAFEPFAQAEIARLEEQRLAALEARVEADLAAGRHAALVERAAAAAGRAPDARAACGPADARALPQRTPGRGAGGLSRGPPRPRRRGRHRARARAAAPARGRPRSGSVARSAGAGQRPAARARRRRGAAAGRPRRRAGAAARALGGGADRRGPSRHGVRSRGDREDAACGRAGRRGPARRRRGAVYLAGRGPPAAVLAALGELRGDDAPDARRPRRRRPGRRRGRRRRSARWRWPGCPCSCWSRGCEALDAVSAPTTRSLLGPLDAEAVRAVAAGSRRPRRVAARRRRRSAAPGSRAGEPVGAARGGAPRRGGGRAHGGRPCRAALDGG